MMKIPKRKQILLLTEADRPLTQIVVTRLVLVVEISKVSKFGAQVLGIAYNSTGPENLWVWGSSITKKIDVQYGINVHKLRARGCSVEVVGKDYLPLCLDWERGETFDKILKREL